MATGPTINSTLVQKIFQRMFSEHEGERLAAVNVLIRTLSNANVSPTEIVLYTHGDAAQKELDEALEDCEHYMEQIGELRDEIEKLKQNQTVQNSDLSFRWSEFESLANHVTTLEHGWQTKISEFLQGNYDRTAPLSQWKARDAVPAWAFVALQGEVVRLQSELLTTFKTENARLASVNAALNTENDVLLNRWNEAVDDYNRVIGVNPETVPVIDLEIDHMLSSKETLHSAENWNEFVSLCAQIVPIERGWQTHILELLNKTREKPISKPVISSWKHGRIHRIPAWVFAALNDHINGDTFVPYTHATENVVGT
jgi:FtsZ-binding cell division protein ZapB